MYFIKADIVGHQGMGKLRKVKVNLAIVDFFMNLDCHILGSE